MNNISIQKLVNCQGHIPTLAKLWYEEISRHWVVDSSVEKAKQKLIAHANSDNLPIAFVALHDNQPIGMACLRENDGIRVGVAPWLGSLMVNPSFRGYKVGEMLINSIKCEARKLGHQVLYLLAFDPKIPEWYARLGWKNIGDDKLFDHRVTVMNIIL